MKRIPIIIIIAAFLTASIPFLGYTIVSLSKMIPFYHFTRIISQYNIFQIIFNLFLIAVSIGMLRIQKWSFVSFILLSISLLIYSIGVIILSLFGFGWYEFQITDYTILFGLISILIAFLAYIIRKELSMPYFSILGRGWRLSRRESLPVKIEWNYELDQKGYGLTENISSKGCLLPLTDSMELVFLPGSEVQINLYFMDDKTLKVIPVRGIVLRVEEKILNDPRIELSSKAGIIFNYTNGRSDERWVSNFLNEKYSPRYSTQMSASIHLNKVAIPVKMFNISRTGMYLISNEMIPVKSEITIEFQTKLGKINCNGIIIWTNPEGFYGKPPGFGIKITTVNNLFKFYIYLLFLAYLDDIRR